MAEHRARRPTHFTIRAEALKLVTPPGVRAEDELVIIDRIASKNELPIASAALLNFAHNGPDELLAPRILREPNLLLGDGALRVLELGNIIEGYKSKQVYDYIADAGRDAFPTERDIKARKRRALKALRSIYRDVDPRIPDLYARTANYIGGMTALIALLRRYRDNIYNKHANVPSLAAAASMELAASVDIDFEPHVLQVFPHPETGEPLDVATFIRRAG